MNKPKIVLCDSHPMIQQGVDLLLSAEFDIAAAVPDGRAALRSVAALLPAVLILDVSLPALNGFEVSRQLRNQDSRPKVVFYTACTSPAFVREGFRAGAAAYVAKSAAVSDLLRAVRAVVRGQKFISVPDSDGSLVFRNNDGNGQSPFRELTPRQCEVLQLVGEGLSAKEIAAELNVVQKTVEFHKNALMEALKLKSSAQLVRFAVESGLVGALGDPNVKNLAELRKSSTEMVNGVGKEFPETKLELAQDTTGALTTSLLTQEP